ncbi:glycosyltransferase involved in cell wall biosynthesis [Paenarthrobacter nicotinovorans]|uniref:glycosyltransferase n=1 Tax=Micrococcaceae TaxID=1268 RepID=UPI0011138F33|nr:MULTISPECIES: glycosyltransferase [Micrococcaceae]MDR6435350.1 glycosyltransferase involved in cell wall biosynthesis [Paenarthrobacter nicotinovorans]
MAIITLFVVAIVAFSFASTGLIGRLKENRRLQRESQASVKKYLLTLQRQLADVTQAQSASTAQLSDLKEAYGASTAQLAELKKTHRASMAALTKQVEGTTKTVSVADPELEAERERLLQLVENHKSELEEKVQEVEVRHLERQFNLVALDGSNWHLFSGSEVKKLAETQFNAKPLAVYEMLEAHACFDKINMTSLRGLASELRKLGYTAKSQHVLRVVLDRKPNEKLASAISLRDEEVKIFTGAYKPAPQGPYERFAPKPNCILHVVGKVLPTTQSGYTLRTHYTALAQIQSGLEVHVCNQVGDAVNADVAEQVELDGVTYHLPTGPIRVNTPLTTWLSANVEELARVVSEVRPAVLHAHSDFFNALSARAVGDYFEIPVIYESRGFWEESWLSRMAQASGIEDIEAFSSRWGTPDTYAWRRERERDCREAADHVFTLAEVMKRRITAEGCPEDKTSVVPNAVSGDQFPVQTRNAELAGELGIQSDEIVIGYISSLVEYEGVPVLIEAFNQLRERLNVPVRLLVVGDGPVLDALKTTAASLGLHDALFTGRVPHDDILDYYGLIDIFVVPRTAAAVCQLVTPLKPFEAFATGRTIVMSDVDALKEIAEASGSAALFEAGNSGSLADVLFELVSSPETRSQMAAAGAAWVRESRSWEANAAVYNHQYANLAANAIRV